MSETFDPRTTPWSIDASDFYDLDSFSEQMKFVLRYAVLAPSTHNTQPWSFRVTRTGVDVFADSSRRMPVVDPKDREHFMSVGAAIMNFRIAAAHFGFETEVLYESRPEESWPVATIFVRETCAPDKHLDELFTSIRKRHTNRRSFDGEIIDPDVLSRVCDVMDEYPDNFRAIMPHEKERVAELIEYAEQQQLARPAWRDEAAQWMHPNSGYSDGICTDGLGLPQPISSAAPWLMRHALMTGPQSRRDRDLAAGASALIVVTANDNRIELIQAGEALERMLLMITKVGLQYSFLNQPIEMDSLRDRIQTVIGTRVPAQLLIRVGYAPAVEKAMPRRPVESVVQNG